MGQKSSFFISIPQYKHGKKLYFFFINRYTLYKDGNIDKLKEELGKYWKKDIEKDERRR